jgi:transposase-like protein
VSKRTFDAAFKAKVVLEVISGEKDINQVASDYHLVPNLIRNWRKEFLLNAARVFETKTVNDQTDPDIKDLIRKVDQLTLQVNWMKKKSEEIFGPEWEDVFAPKPKGI